MPPTLGDNIDLGLLKMHKRSVGSEKQIVSRLTGRLAVRAQWPEWLRTGLACPGPCSGPTLPVLTLLCLLLECKRYLGLGCARRSRRAALVGTREVAQGLLVYTIPAKGRGSSFS